MQDFYFVEEFISQFGIIYYSKGLNTSTTTAAFWETKEQSAEFDSGGGTLQLLARSLTLS